MKFDRFSSTVATLVGSPSAFFLAILFVLAWLQAGPRTNYSSHWQLVINTTTTIITFLIVFVIQNTQNRDSKAIHAKLDELIRAIDAANNDLRRVEDLTTEEIDEQRDGGGQGDG